MPTRTTRRRVSARRERVARTRGRAMDDARHRPRPRRLDDDDDGWNDDGWNDDEDATATDASSSYGERARERDAEADRDAVVMLVDASPSMFARDATRAGGRAAFSAAARACFEFVRARVVVAPDDVVGVCAYNARKSVGGLGHPRVCEVLEAEAPSAASALALREYADGEEGARKFRERFGVLSREEDGEDVDFNQEEALTAGLWAASHMLENGPRGAGRKSVYLFTNEPAPLKSGSAGTKLIARAKEMAALGQRIEVLSLTRDGKFDSSVFYDAFTKEHCGAREGDNALVVVEDGSELQKEFLKKSRKRRRLKQTKLWLVPGKIGIPVGVYALVSEAKKSASILVDGKDLGEIRREQIYVDADSGAQIEKPTKSFVEIDGKQLVFTNKELAKAKMMNIAGVEDKKDAVGFHLVGFVSAEKITRDLSLKKSHFITAEDKGCAAFQGLLRACADDGKVIICAFSRSTRTAFRYVALLPQLAPALGALDDAVSRLDPPEGFHVFYLPFRDDRRRPESAVASARAPLPRANEEQIAAARAVVDSIRLVGWHPKQTPNPAIQTHYRVLEMCALERNVMEPVNDDTEPALDEWQKVGVPALLADYDEKCFGRARAIDDHHGRAQPIDTAAKRPRTSDDTPSHQRARRPDPITTVLPPYADVVERVRDDSLKSCVVDVLKQFCAAHNLSTSGSKATLLDRVDAHVRLFAADALD